MPEPVLRVGSNGNWTNASLRDTFRWRISQKEPYERLAYAYEVLSQFALTRNFTRTQMRAVATGLKLGMNEGVNEQ